MSSPGSIEKMKRSGCNSANEIATRILKSINQVKRVAVQESADTKEIHYRLFEIYAETEKSFVYFEDAHVDEELLDALTVAQSELLSVASSIKANSAQDILFKLALWRWAASEDPEYSMEGADQAAYSAFKDLVDLVGDYSVLKNTDLRLVKG